MDTGMLYTKDPVLLAEEREHFLLNEFHPVEDTGFERTCHADRYVFLFTDVDDVSAVTDGGMDLFAVIGCVP